MHTQALDAKLNRITNGERMGLDYIEVPKGEWFYSSQNDEKFQYNNGVFEEYPKKEKDCWIYSFN